MQCPAILNPSPWTADDYLIDHSIMFYLMDEQGNFVDYFGKSLAVEAIADKISRSIIHEPHARNPNPQTLNPEDSQVNYA